MTDLAEGKRARNVETSNARGDRTFGERGNEASPHRRAAVLTIILKSGFVKVHRRQPEIRIRIRGRGQKKQGFVARSSAQPNFLNYTLWFSFHRDFVALKSLQKSILLTF
jgi:hypothetical protein